MAKTIKVRYNFEMTVRYAGTLEMTEERFKKLDAIKSEERLSEALSELVDLQDPLDWEPGDCWEFQPVDDNGKPLPDYDNDPDEEEED